MTLPRGWLSEVTVTVLWGAARPATTMPPSGLTRTISKLGLTTCGGEAEVDAEDPVPPVAADTVVVAPVVVAADPVAADPVAAEGALAEAAEAVSPVEPDAVPLVVVAADGCVVVPVCAAVPLLAAVVAVAEDAWLPD